MNSELTKEQIEEWRKELTNTGCKITSDEADALCDLALVGLSVQPRPIADAPKDGTLMLLHWIASSSFVVGKYCTREKAFQGTDGAYFSVNPTHFIHLSSLPTPKDK